MEFISELNDTNIKQMCRTCLTINTEEMTSIFDEIEQMENDKNIKTFICDMLLDVAPIQLNTKESLPTTICINCLQLTQKLFNFRRQCNRSQAILLEYLTEKSPNPDGDVLNKKCINQDEHENIIIKHEVHELTNSCSSDQLLNDNIKLEFVDEINNSDIESVTKKEDNVIGALDAEKSSNHDGYGLNEKSIIKESIHISLNKIKPESITIENDFHELSNPSSSDDLLYTRFKSEFVECEETLYSKLNYNKEENVFTCHFCDKSFETDTLYFTHMQQHTEDERVCKICNKHFKHQKNLTAHMNTHKKRHLCTLCGKDYKHLSTLLRCMRLHTGRTPISCSVCCKGFWTASSLKLHMKIHTKLYMCNICGETMSTLNDLVRHVRAHNGDRPYKCTICSKDFRTSLMFKRHSDIHSGLKPFSCDVCKKSFSRKSNLNVHTKLHTNEKNITSDKS